MQKEKRLEDIKRRENSRIHKRYSTQKIISDISEDIEAGLTTCYGDYFTWKKKNTN